MPLSLRVTTFASCCAPPLTCSLRLQVLVEGEQLEIYVQAVGALKLQAEDGPARGVLRQTGASDVAELIIQAAEVKASFGETVEALSAATGAKCDVPASLKRVSRVLEKVPLGL